MKATLLTLLLCLVLLPFAQAQEPPQPPELEMDVENMTPEFLEVKNAIHRFGRMWEDEDMATFDSLIAKDADMVIIGTDDAEYMVGFANFREAREKQYASYENVEFNVYNQHIKLSQSGDVAWFTETFDLFLIAQGNPVSLQGIRLSGVLEKRNGNWKVVQLHTSVPVQGQAAEY